MIHAKSKVFYKFWEVFQKLIRNNRSEERWGMEEKELEILFPFKKKRAFDLLFYCDENRFLVSLPFLSCKTEFLNFYMKSLIIILIWMVTVPCE